MSGPARLGAFAAVLVVAFAAAVGAGRAIDPNTGARQDSHGKDEKKMQGMAKEHGGHAAEAASGLAVAEGGLRLMPQRTTLEAGREAPYNFRIASSGGTTVRQFDLEHTRRMHMIVVRRDMIGYQHVHPRQQSDGSWSVNLRLRDPGVYRVYADFGTKGESHTLATDLFVPGDFKPRALPPGAERASTDGYDVALHTHGRDRGFTVTRGDRPVQVQPYLGADGHLVALREGDLAFLHMHPMSDHGAKPGVIAFDAQYPSKGRYRLFLQFKHAGRVHTVAFTEEVR